ncbi:MAG: M28 family peptidase [Woeseiaceae bacterium]
MKNSLLIAALAAALTLAACTKQEQPAEVAAESGDDTSVRVNIDGEYMRMIVKEISDDRYEGRGPGSRGDKMARDYLAQQMADMGLQPGGADGSFEQPFDLVGVDTKQPPAWTFDTDNGSLTLKQWDDFIVGSGIQDDRASIEDVELVFAGYGIQAPEFNWDDYKDVDVRGKLLIIMNNDPDWDPELFAGERRLWYGRWDYKYEMAAKLGAAGVLIIHTTPSAGYPFQVLQTSGTGPQFQLPAGDEPRNVLEGWITEDAARELIANSGHDLDALYEAAYNRDFKPVPLGIKTSVGMDVEITRVQTANVLGLIPGGDPDLRDEVVIYTAHHDHLGIGTPNDDGDAIYNGAYDNATGVAIVLAIAAAISDLQEAPRRSVLVALVGAEEQGLLGSKYYAANPTFPAGKIAANMNFDGGNIWGHTHDVTFIGFGKSSIDELVTAYADEQGRTVQPDQFVDRGYFYRSDQFSFAKIGVPAAYLDPGTSFVDKPEGWGKAQIDHFTDHNYHQPSDEYDDSWTFVGAVEDALLGYWTGLAIANADDMPTWNAGDEFEAARLKAIAELED